jgi:hypothetical protein
MVFNTPLQTCIRVSNEEITMFCTKCGVNLTSDAKFCVGCGTKVMGGSSESIPSDHAALKTTPAFVEQVARTSGKAGQQHLSGAQALKWIGGVLGVGLIFGIGASFLSDNKTSGNSPSAGNANQQTAFAAPVAVAPTSYPAECNEKHFSLMALYSGPDATTGIYDRFSSAEGKAWLAVFANGNYEILDGKLLTDKDGSHYCMVRVHISGTYGGNSYDGTYYAMAI